MASKWLVTLLSNCLIFLPYYSATELGFSHKDSLSRWTCLHINSSSSWWGSKWLWACKWALDTCPYGTRSHLVMVYIFYYNDTLTDVEIVILQVESIVLSIISMLSSPNDESPANVEAAVSELSSLLHCQSNFYGSFVLYFSEVWICKCWII